jgi:hypothetical protein
LIVLSFNELVQPESVHGYVVGYPDNLKITPTTKNRFFIKNAPDGDHSILVNAIGVGGTPIGALINKVKVLNGTTTELYDLTLQPTQELAVSIKDSTNNKNIPLCEIRLFGTNLKSECNSQEVVKIRNVPKGVYTIGISSPNYRPGIWRELEASVISASMPFYLSPSKNDFGVLKIISGQLVDNVRTSTVVLAVPNHPRDGEWREMKIAINAVFGSDINWEPLRTSFVYQPPSGLEYSSLGVVFRDKLGYESEVFRGFVALAGLEMGLEAAPMPKQCSTFTNQAQCNMDTSCFWSHNTCTRPKASLGSVFYSGDGLSAIGSSNILGLNCNFSVLFNGDGAFVIYQGKRAIWSSQTKDKGATKAQFLDDGNFVIGNDESVLFVTATANKQATMLVLGRNGNLVILNRQNAVIWQSGSPVHGCY